MTVFAFIIIYLAALAAIFVWLVRQEYKLPTIACGEDKDDGQTMQPRRLDQADRRANRRPDPSSDTGGHF